MSNYTKTTDFEAKDSLPSGDSGKIIRGSEFETEFDNIATAIATKADAADPTFTGTVTIDGLTVNGNTTLGNAATDTVTVTADIASNLIPSADDTYNLGASGAEWNDLFIDGTANIDSLVAGSGSFTSISTTGDVTFGDNDKAIFGTGSDLQIYHTGSASFIYEGGTGNLVLRANDLIAQTTGGANYLQADSGGSLRLYYNGVERLETLNAGVDVTGTVTADGLTVDGTGTFNGSPLVISNVTNPRIDLIDTTNNTDARIQSGDAGSIALLADQNNEASGTSISGYVDGKQTFKSDAGGDFSLYEDTGTTAKFFWDASAERLGLGTTSPASTLHLFEANPTITFQEGAGSTTISGDAANLEYTVPSGKYHVFSGGNVGIGTTSPADNLHLFDSTNAGIKFTNTASGSTASDGFSAGFDNSQTAYFWNYENGGMKFATNNAERVRIDSSGNVGIGASSPSHKLDVNGNAQISAATGSGTLNLVSSENVLNAGQKIAFFGANRSTANEEHAYIKSLMTSNSGGAGNVQTGHLTFGTSGSERVRITSDGDVGIGTTSPQGALSVSNGGAEGVEIDYTGGTMRIVSFDRTAVTDSSLEYRASEHVFKVSTSEKARIDSSGNLLVGKTSNGSTLAGFETSGDGTCAITRDGGQPLLLNRLTSDGDLVLFRKDNATVGSIGVGNSDNLVIEGNSTHSGLQFGTSVVLPHRNGALVDDNINLGTSSSRFKDLYLSGGAYLGGTAAANKLDDYEEGTFTPAVIGTTTAGTATYATQYGKYTKVGNLVFVQIYVSYSSHTGTGDMQISGLPFIAYSQAGLSIGDAANLSVPANTTAKAATVFNSSTIRLRTTSTTSGTYSDSNLAIDDIATLNISGVYRIN